MADAFAHYLNKVVVSQPVFSSEGLTDRNLIIPDDALVTLPADGQPGSRYADDVWAWPESLLPHKAPSTRRINFKLPHDLIAAGAPGLHKTIKKLIVLSIFVPLGRLARLPSHQVRQRLLNEFAYRLIHEFDIKSFSAIDPAIYEQLVINLGRGRKGHVEKLVSHLSAFRLYGKRGLIDDYPGADCTNLLDVSRNVSISVERRSKATPDQIEEDHESTRQTVYLPLPDQYISEMGWRCVFYLDVIGPNLARMFAAHPDAPAQRKLWMPIGRRGDPTKGSVKQARTEAWKRFLADYKWIDKDGEPIGEIPFSCDHLQFPPKKYVDLEKLVSRHMDSAIHILLLLSGGRQSEVSSMQRSTVPNSPHDIGDVSFGVVNGSTFKSSVVNSGDKRSWPIPLKVLGWLENQALLARELGPADSSSLWMGMSTTHVGGKRIDTYYRCVEFARRHGLDHHVDGTAHPHRYRKTVARLALLALTGAPTLVMEMFGHTDLKTTLHYLLSDPFIQDDLREMLGERRFEVAMNIMEDLDQSAGPAAKIIRSARDAYFDSMEIPQNARSQKIKMAEFVTAHIIDGAVDVKIIFPGIVCVRGLEQTGACSEKGRSINPGKCNTRCGFRLELSLRRQEVCSIIEDLLDTYFKEIENGNTLLQAFCAHNLIDHVDIFPDVKEHYESDLRFQKVVEWHGRA